VFSTENRQYYPLAVFCFMQGAIFALNAVVSVLSSLLKRS
jgi:hypothetical protein